MMIAPFQRSRKDWILVVGLRSFPKVDLAASASSAGGFSSMTYDRHWTKNNTWSAFAAAMTFTSQEAAVDFLNKNRDRMDVANVED